MLISVKRTTGFLFGSLALSTLFSQPIYFNNTYDFNGEANIGQSVVVGTNGYKVLGVRWDSLGMQKLTLTNLTDSGQLILQKTWGQTGLHYDPGLVSLTLLPDSGFVVLGSVQYASLDSDVMLWRFNRDGDTLWTKIYQDSNVFEYGSKIALCQDGGYLLGGFIDSVGYSSLIIRIDSSGNELWRKLYDHGTVLSIDTCMDGGFVLGFQKQLGGDLDPYVVKTDSLGNEAWSWTSGGPFDEIGANVIAASNGDYIVATDTTLSQHPSPSVDYSIPKIVRLDSVGNEKWTTCINTDSIEAGPSIVRELGNGDIIVVGQKVSNLSSESILGVVARLTIDGDSIWYRELSFCPNGSGFDYLRDIRTSPDGGFLVVGWQSNSSCEPDQDLWVMKLDSVGCPFVGCDSVSTTTPLPLFRPTLRIYPNPSSGIIYVQASKSMNERIQVLDMLGRAVVDSQILGKNHHIDLRNQPGGVYILRIRGYTQKVLLSK